MTAPLAITHVVMACDAASLELSRSHLADLHRLLDRPPPGREQTHIRLDAGPFKLRWELHTEFVTWTFLRPLAEVGATPMDHAAASVPRHWFAGLPGLYLSGLHLLVCEAAAAEVEAIVARHLHEQALVAARVAGGAADVYADFALREDSFTHMVVASHAMAPRQLGRLVQHLLEIDTYRMAALLGLPAARDAAAFLGKAEQELASLALAVRRAAREQEAALLDRLTRLAAQVEGLYAASHSRFSASAAYFELVDRRLDSVAEQPLGTLQTLGDFIERRLGPARSTCEWVNRRQEALSRRVSQMSNLLRTRVEIAQQESSQAVLAAMNRRQGVQLQLQTTVEGLSVAAITYYIVGLANYAAKAGQSLGWPWSPEGTAAATIPLVAGGVWWSLRKLHRRVLLDRGA